MAATDARPVPKKNVAYRHYFHIRNADGSLITSWTGQDSEVSKDGATMADCTNEATEIATTTGCGYLDLTSTEMNADCVVLKVTVTNTDALPYVVALFPEEAGDIRVDVTQLGSDSQSATDLKDFADAGYDPGTNKVQGVVLVDTTTTNTDMVSAAPSAASIADAVWDETQSTHVTAGSFGEIATEIASILADTNELQTDDVPGLIAALNDPTAAAIADAVWDETQSTHVTAGSFGEIATEIAAILVDTAELQANQGNWLTATGFSTHTAANVRTEMDSNSTQLAAIVADTNELQTDDVPGLIAALNDPTAAAIADAVWDEVITGAAHNVSTSAAKFLREASTATIGTTGTLQSATSTTAVLAVGAVPSDDYFNGERLTILEGTGLGQSRLIIDSTASSDTVTLGHAWATTPDNTSVYGIVGAEADIRSVAEFAVTATASVDFDDLAAILTDTNELQTDDVPGLIAALNNISAADVNAQVLDVLATDTFAEPSGVPGATATLEDKISWLYTVARNKITQTATTTTLRNDADSGNIATSTISDDGTTYTRGEYA